MATIPIPQGATIGSPDNQGAVPIPEGASIGAPDQAQEKPGILKRLAQSVGLPSSEEELSAMSPQSPGEAIKGVIVNSPPGVAAQMIVGAGEGVVRGAKLAGKESYEAGQNIAAGEPVAQNVGKAAAGAVQGATESVPVIGHAVNTVGEDISQGNYRGAAGGLMGVLAQVVLPYAVEHGMPAVKAKLGELANAKEAPAPADATAKPGLIKKVIKGSDVAQPGAQQAIRTAAKAGAEPSKTGVVGGKVGNPTNENGFVPAARKELGPDASPSAVMMKAQDLKNAAAAADKAAVSSIETKPLIKGNDTLLDDHINNLFRKEKAAYRVVDDTVGFDLKAEKLQLSNDKYKLNQLGNTDADITQRGKLIEAINDSTDRIAEAEGKLRAAGLDPKAADAIHQQRMAGLDFKKSLIKNATPDGQAVNIDGLLNDAKKMRFHPKYGDRLQQFFGSKEVADGYVSELLKMQKMGVHAAKVQRIAVLVAKVAAGAVIGGEAARVGYEMAH